jgi:hypothetical protein
VKSQGGFSLHPARSGAFCTNLVEVPNATKLRKAGSRKAAKLMVGQDIMA